MSAKSHENAKQLPDAMLDTLPDLLPRRTQAQRKAELGRDLVSAALLKGHFVLSSGATSNYYLDKYLFETKPGILRRLATGLAEIIPAETDLLAGPELGAVALAAAVSLETGLPFVIVTRQAKAYGTGRVVEGELQRGHRVVLIEDVISTGTQAIRAAEVIARAGASVLAIVAVIDREQGGAERIAAAGFAYRSLFGKSELGI